jgi:eukaryotic-like serine/threonine-protein kinase
MTEDLRRGAKLGKYELLLRIGRGGMATVWVAKEHAENPDDERLVAVKAMLHELSNDPEFVTMFLDEGRLVQSIRHPNVVEVYEVGDSAGTVFMSMEWVEGDSLHTLIAEAGKRRPIPPEMAVRIVADAAHGLSAAHQLKGPDGQSLGVVHRDVSPHNILIGTDGAVRLVDFGVAKATGRVSDATVAGQLKGKFGYMSPEQAKAKTVDQRSDIFSLGTVLFELTTGRRLFRGEHDAETLRLVVSGQIPRPTSIDAAYPPELETIVLKALNRDVNKRYQNAAAMREDLEAYLKSRRIVVARAGIAALLKRVLGARIEQRRRALRSALETLAGGPAAGVSLIGADAAFANVTASGVSMPGRASGSFSGSDLSAPSDISTSTPSGAGSASSAPSSRSNASLTGATSPQTVTNLGERRRGTIPYAIAGALLLALVVFMLFIAMQRKTTTTALTIPAASPVETAAPGPPKPASSDENLPTVSLDKLKVMERERERQNPDRNSAPRSAGSGAVPSKKPAEPAASTAPPPVELPRENPY